MSVHELTRRCRGLGGKRSTRLSHFPLSHSALAGVSVGVPVSHGVHQEESLEAVRGGMSKNQSVDRSFPSAEAGNG